MANPKSSIGKSEKYTALTKEANKLKEKRDCSVVSLSVVCGVSYARAHKALADAGRKPQTSVSTKKILDAAKALGQKAERVSLKKIIGLYPAGHRTALKHVTSHHPERFNSVWADGCNYLMITTNHVLAITNGNVHDWSIGHALRATDLYKITKD